MHAAIWIYLHLSGDLIPRLLVRSHITEATTQQQQQQQQQQQVVVVWPQTVVDTQAREGSKAVGCNTWSAKVG